MRRAFLTLIAATAAVLLALSVTAAGEAVFFPVSVYIDSGDRSLAAYQFEILYDEDALVIVGIEGGDDPFVDAPYHDPEGLQAGRIVIAAFTTGEDTPNGRVRVARLHLMREGRPDRPTDAHLVLAAGPEGERHEATIELVYDEGGEDE